MKTARDYFEEIYASYNMGENDVAWSIFLSGWRAAERESKSICPFVEEVREKYRVRALHGMKKYGVTMDRNDIDLDEWLTLAQEEAMDFTIYIERIRRELEQNRHVK